MTKNIMTIEEVAEELRLSTIQIRRLIREQGLPHFRISERRFLIDRADLEEWLEARREVREGRSEY
jgi:excisionase family DNA binding protein